MVDLERLSKDNAIYRSLLEFGLITPENIKVLHPRTRDREITVLHDRKTEVVFLQTLSGERAYRESETPTDLEGLNIIVQTRGGNFIKSRKLDDENRRYLQFKNRYAGKSVCDFGTGHGFFLDNCLGAASRVCGVELRGECIAEINERLGSSVVVKQNIGDFDETFDVITLFHVLEHMEDQIEILKTIKSRLRPGGELIVEVPHARDFLSYKMELKEFRDFMFWSDHLILHTKETLSRFLAEAGFEEVKISGFQRYNFANHLYWLRHGKPGGHEKFQQLTSDDFDREYSAYLEENEWTDTLMATARSGP